MGDIAKIILGVVLRHGLTLLSGVLGTIGLTEAEKGQLLNPELIASIVAAIVALGASYYFKALSKLKEKLALELPKGSDEAALQKATDKQSVKDVLKTEPK